MEPKPPSLFDSLLKWYCSESDLEDLQGDLYEVFEERAKNSKLRANYFFVLDVLRLFLPFVKKRRRTTWLSDSYSFNLRNQVLVSFRYLRKYPFVNTLKIGGLAIAISAFLYISDYTRFHNNFDQFHEKKDRIYRVITRVSSEDLQDVTAWSHSYLKELTDEFPGVEQIVRLLKEEDLLHVQVGDKNFKEYVFYTDPEFAEIFTYTWLEGDPETALSSPDNVVITNVIAQKYFNTSSGVVGKTITINDGDFIVSGLIEEAPANSDLKFDLLLPFSDRSLEDWSFVYVLLRKDANILDLENQFAEVMGELDHEYSVQGVELVYEFENMTDIHFSEKKLYDTPKMDKERIQLFQLIGWVILLIALFNYVNLHTTQTLRRLSNINVHRVIGATKKQLFFQFATEAFLYLGIALSVGVLLTFGSARLVGNYAGFHFFRIPLTHSYLTGIFIVYLFTTIALATYSLVVVTRSSASLFEIKMAKVYFRKSLVGVQFALSFAMILTTVIIYQQTALLKNQDLGFDWNRAITFHIPDNVERNKAKLIKQEIVNLNVVHAVSQVESNSVPGMDADVDDYYVNNSIKTKLFEGINVDESFLKVLDIELLVGEFFSEKKGHKPYRVFVVNEAFVKHLGWKPQDALGKRIEAYNTGGPIIGVVRNFYFNSPHQLIQPMIINYDNTGGYTLAKVSSKVSLIAAINRIEGVWKDHLPDVPFNFSFLLTDYEEQFKQERATINVFAIVASLVIALSLLGMYAILLMLRKFREKELSIRKVNGASLEDLFKLFSREFVKILIISIIAMIPLLWYGLSNWLAKYPLRVSLSPTYFALTAVFVILIAGGVIYIQAFRSYKANTVDALKYE